MVKQYPHIILITRKPEPVKGTDGNYSVANTSAAILNSVCRAEPAGSNPVLKGADGDLIYYSFVVYMPKSDIELKYGDETLITFSENVIHSGIVKQHSNGQLNSRIWV